MILLKDNSIILCVISIVCVVLCIILYLLSRICSIIHEKGCMHTTILKTFCIFAL